MEGDKDVPKVKSSSAQKDFSGLGDRLSDSKGSCTNCQPINSASSSNITATCNVKKIYPSEAELSTINNCIQCSEDNCHEIFTSNSNLNLHLYKTHKIKDAIRSDAVPTQFHCPDMQCIYHENQFFKNKKLLKQHYLKVHSPKIYICETCKEGFPSKVYKNMHVDYCGVMFKCSECPVSYSKYESLLTHGRRKNHEISEKITFKLKKSEYKPILSISKSESNISNKLKPVLPRPSSSVQLVIISKNMNKSDQSIQTDQTVTKLKSKLTQLNKNSLILKKDTRQTQTGSRKEHLTVETQTIGDYLKRKEIVADNKQKQFMKTQSSTQTHSVPSKSVSSNTNIDVDDLVFPKATDVKRSSSSTQTVVQSPIDNILHSYTTSTHDSVHTDTSDLMESNLENFDTTFFNCNMETQTDLIFDDNLFDYCDYYSNMYTQTCEDMLLNSLELNNIETQTVDEMLRSVESQTTMSQNKKPQMSCRDISHMETQTDMEFKKMLEAINA